MPIFRWGQAFEAFADLEREFDRLLQTAAASARVGRLFPPINLYEQPNQFLLLAQIPGVTAEALDIQVADRQLTLRGERVAPDGVAETQFRRRERLGGPWERTVALPDRVDEDGIAAEFDNGLLVLRLPKTKPSVGRQIAVSEGSDTLGSRPVSSQKLLASRSQPGSATGTPEDQP